ncbi:hypothetical protein VPH35_121849 [Triticum aestivum]
MRWVHSNWNSVRLQLFLNESKSSLVTFPSSLSASSFSIGGSQHLSQFVQHLIQDLGAPKSCERLQEQDSATSVRHRMKEGKSMSYINLDFFHVVRIYARHDT